MQKLTNNNDKKKSLKSRKFFKNSLNSANIGIMIDIKLLRHAFYYRNLCVKEFFKLLVKN